VVGGHCRATLCCVQWRLVWLLRSERRWCPIPADTQGQGGYARDAPTWASQGTYRLCPAAPAAAPDVWRRLGRLFPNGSHEVTVLIKVRPSQGGACSLFVSSR